MIDQDEQSLQEIMDEIGGEIEETTGEVTLEDLQHQYASVKDAAAELEDANREFNMANYEFNQMVAEYYTQTHGPFMYQPGDIVSGPDLSRIDGSERITMAVESILSSQAIATYKVYNIYLGYELEVGPTADVVLASIPKNPTDTIYHYTVMCELVDKHYTVQEKDDDV